MRKVKVLYLDDEPDLCEIFSEAVSSDEIEVRAVSAVADALSLGEAWRPDFAVIDYRLPGETGDSVAKRMRPGPTFMLVTGDLSPPDNILFAYILKKPIDFPGLIKVLKEKSCEKLCSS